MLGRTGFGLFTFGIALRWGDSGVCLEPSVGSVPYDTEIEARRAAFEELIAMLETGRGAVKNQQQRLLLTAVKHRDRDRGPFG